MKLPKFLHTAPPGNALSISFGGNQFTFFLREEVTLGKVILDPCLIALLGYPSENVTPVVEGFCCDRETFVGNEPTEVKLIVSASYKALLTVDELKRKLRKLGGCNFVRQGSGHEIWEAPSGHRFPIPRHAGDLRISTVRDILRQAGLTMSIREFASA
jgi:predicted RNA binding protein YcfA (HicA-like mRNA interferase family)